MSNQQPNIFEYTNYRRYLNDLYLFKKAASKYFSHRVFVRMCGFSSPNFLKLVIDGKRNLGKKAQEKLIAVVGRNKLEREYLKAMVLFDQAGTGEEKDEFLSVISRLRHRAKVKTIEVDQYEYLSRWYNVAIRELVGLEGFTEDAKWINKKLGTRLTDKMIRDIIDQLLALNILTRNEKGILRQVDTNIICAPEIFSVAVHNYHKQMIEKSSEALEKTKSKDRDISALTVSIDRETFEKITDEIRKCRENIHHLAETSKQKDVVYQLNIQLFNLSEVLWKSKE